MKHEMQHPDSPTWCVHCGTFDVYCGDDDCSGPRNAKWDSTKYTREEKEKMIFGELAELENRCTSKFNGPTPYRCELQSGHSGQHYSECSNPEFSQKW